MLTWNNTWTLVFHTQGALLNVCCMEPGTSVATKLWLLAAIFFELRGTNEQQEEDWVKKKGGYDYDHNILYNLF